MPFEWLIGKPGNDAEKDDAVLDFVHNVSYVPFNHLEVVVSEGAWNKAMYFVVAGKARGVAKGKVRTNDYAAGDIFGERGMLDELRRKNDPPDELESQSPAEKRSVPNSMQVSHQRPESRALHSRVLDVRHASGNRVTVPPARRL